AIVKTHADGSFAYSYSVGADGTKTSDYYDASGNLTMAAVVHADGSSDTQSFTAGVLTGETIKYAPGGAELSDTRTFTAGVLTRDAQVHADGSRDIYVSNVQDQSYTSEHDVYNTAGGLTAIVKTHADGSLAYSYSVGADGTKTSDYYDASGNLTSVAVAHTDGSSDTQSFTAGVLTRDAQVHADGSRDIYVSNVQNQSYTSEHDVYNTAGGLTAIVKTHADGSFAYSYSVGADG